MFMFKITAFKPKIVHFVTFSNYKLLIFIKQIKINIGNILSQNTIEI